MGTVLLLVGSWAGSGHGSAQEAKKDGKTETQARPVFAEADAVRVMSDLRRALESDRQSRLLKLFDAQRMPGYAAFRDEVAEFYAKYSLIQLNYHITQVAMDREFGAVMAEITLEAAPYETGTPSVRRNAQARLVLAWDGKAWKIADLSPRDLFRTGS